MTVFLISMLDWASELEDTDLDTAAIVAFMVLLLYNLISTIILIMYRKVGKLSVVIGEQNISISSRKEDARENAKDFIQEVHSLSDIRKPKSFGGISGLRKILKLKIITL
ncbi:MAG: hypothetical protein BAJALOKI2v1_520025 [Promethearchaeota archaeon]|nr:MAG: hypothetical protein BAJALOKI2v1_520025 [Candidatus Lokiarchaeota archaeon]